MSSEDDLQQAIHAATIAAAVALSRHSIQDPIADWTTMARVAVEAAWPALRHTPRHGPEARAEVMESRLQAAQAENRELTRQVEWMRAALLRADPRHEEAIREALEQQAASTEVER